MPTLARRQSILCALFMALAALFLLAGYECVRTPSNTLFKNHFGKQLIPLVIAVTPLAVALTLWLYNRLLTRFGARVTMAITAAASGWLILTTSLLMGRGYTALAFFFYLVREVYIVLLLEQLWSFLNSRLNTAEAGRLYGPVCAIASVGAVAVGYYAPLIVNNLAPWQQPLLAVCLMPVSIILFDLAFRVAGEPKTGDTEAARSAAPASPPAASAAPASEKPHGANLGLTEFRAHPLLVGVLVIVVATQVYAASLEIGFQTALDHAYADPVERDLVSYRFFSLLNLVAAGLQILVVPLAMALIPLRHLHLGIPALHVVLFGVSLILPGFAPMALAYLAFKSIDYSLFKSAKELLYIPLPFDSRYRAKEWIDALGYRAGKGLGGIITLYLTLIGRALGLPGLVLGLGMATLLVWLGAAGYWRLGLPEKPRPVQPASPPNAG